VRVGRARCGEELDTIPDAFGRGRGAACWRVARGSPPQGRGATGGPLGTPTASDVGRRDAEEDVARRQGRAAAGLVVRLRVLSTDSDEYDALVKAIHEYRIGGFHVFGGTEAAPDVLLDANYGTVTLGQPLAAASLLNRLQAIAPYPLLNSADFETGAGFRLEGATAFPRNMAFGAAGDEKLAIRGRPHHRDRVARDRASR
jgi:hypothetical protein